MSEQLEVLTCELCHQRSASVKRGLAWFKQGTSTEGDTIDEPIVYVDRCTDHEACRRRVEAKGERWPLLEAA